MKTSEFIAKLQAELQANGDQEIVIAANKHSYKDTVIVTRGSTTTLALFDKIAD